jgi:hypothetical protein
MILKIGHDIRFFTLILLLELIAFAGAFRMMTNDDSSHTSTYFSSLYACILYMFGNDEITYSLTASPLITRALYLLFLFTINILLLNLLIALMGDAYSTVAMSTISEWRREQCKLTFEHLSFAKRIVKILKRPMLSWIAAARLSDHRNMLSKDHFPKTLHLLFRGCDVVDERQEGGASTGGGGSGGVNGLLNSVSGGGVRIGEGGFTSPESERSTGGIRERGQGGEYQEVKKRLHSIEEQLSNLVKLQYQASGGADGSLLQEEQVGDSHVKNVLFNQIHHRNVDSDDDSDYGD